MIFFHYNSVNSTNDIAIQMAKKGAVEETVISADNQTSGKGRRGRIWWDEPGNSLLMSIILKPKATILDYSYFTFVSSLACAICFEKELRLKVQLKWPNDLFLNEKKLGGILIETANTPDGNAVIIGIGINVNQEHFPNDIQNESVSLKIANISEIDIGYLKYILAYRLVSVYHDYKYFGFDYILQQWKSYMWGINRFIEADTDEYGIVFGRIIGIDNIGSLIVESESGINYQLISANKISIK